MLFIDVLLGANYRVTIPTTFVHRPHCTPLRPNGFGIQTLCKLNVMTRNFSREVSSVSEPNGRIWWPQLWSQCVCRPCTRRCEWSRRVRLDCTCLWPHLRPVLRVRSSRHPCVRRALRTCTHTSGMPATQHNDVTQ